MFTINDDLSIFLTRGDIAFFTVTAKENDKLHVFLPNDVVRFKVTERRSCENVVMQKDFLVQTETDRVEIVLDENDTKIGDVISKPTDYWYEVELNPFTKPQTIIGYDEDGAKILKLFPEGKDVVPVEEDEIPPVDRELSLTSERPIQNQAVARALIGYEERVALAEQRIDGYASDAEQAFEQAIDTYSTNKVEETENTINTEADKAVARVQESSSSAEADADRAEDAAERAEASARRAEAVTDLEIDTALNKNSYNPVANKPVAEAIENCLPKTGGTVANSTNIPLIISNTTEGATQTRIPLQAGGVNLGAFAFNGVDKPAVVLTGGFIKNLIHEGNVADFALPKNGGGTEPTMSTNHPQVLALNNTGDNATTLLVFKQKGVIKGRIGVNWEGKPIYQNSEGANYSLLHTGNKPSGTYTGNGDATSRTVSTGGIGSVCVITSSKGTVLVSKSGAVINGSFSSYVVFRDGILTIVSKDESVNASGQEYVYQVL